MEITQELESSLPQIVKTLDKSRRDILTRSDLQQLISVNAEDWNLHRSIKTSRVINFLWETGQLKEYIFEFPSRKETRYVRGDITDFEIAQSLKKDSYIVHEAAMFINGLTSKKPKTIHINVEQSKSHERKHDSLTQESLDRAFKNKCKISNEIAETCGIKVCVTHGQKTGGLGVAKQRGPSGELLFVTTVERTLIDITVRPIYAGGVNEILSAYKQAKQQKVSIPKLVEMLKKMDYVYPYHQSVGFYMERSGVYKDDEVQLLREIPRNFDFYLEHKMSAPKYSKDWKIYYPASLKA